MLWWLIVSFWNAPDYDQTIRIDDEPWLYLLQWLEEYPTDIAVIRNVSKHLLLIVNNQTVFA